MRIDPGLVNSSLVVQGGSTNTDGLRVPADTKFIAGNDGNSSKETLRRIAAKTAESTDLAVKTIERLAEACEEALKWAEGPHGTWQERARLRNKLREALGKPL